MTRVTGILTVLLLISVNEAAPKPRWDNVKNLQKVKFRYDRKRSDEFSGNRLDSRKWSPHGLQNGNTGCPKWNGPVDWKKPKYSTYHATTTDVNGRKIKLSRRNYRVKKGSLNIRVTRKPRRYFAKREYYCDKKTFRCNHDKRIHCYGTTYKGTPILKNKNNPKSYKWLLHDKCKKEPFCIPSPRYVTGSSRKYSRYLGVNIVGKRLFKYGFFEARVKTARSSVVTAVWMFDDNMNPGYSRWTYEKKNNFYRFESPTVLRSRRWQEIDMLEAMNVERNGLNRKFIPNIHVFSGYKGEFTQRKVQKGKLGPIVLDEVVFTQKNPKFNPPNKERSNSFHLNYGSTADLRRDWSDDWYTVGMYWSPREIRFLLDGKETIRFKNTLVHQPMFWAIGTGINREWAGRGPKDKELGRWSRIDYVRRWTVKTKGARDPPSNLPLRKVMAKEFKSLGNRYKAVDNVFPVKDDGKSLPDPATRFFRNIFSQFSDNSEMSDLFAPFSSPSPSPSSMAEPTPSSESTDTAQDEENIDKQEEFSEGEISDDEQDDATEDDEEFQEDEDISNNELEFAEELVDPSNIFGEGFGLDEPTSPNPLQYVPFEDFEDLPDVPFSFWDNSDDADDDSKDFFPAGGIGNELLSDITGFKPLLSMEEFNILGSREDRFRSPDEESQCDKEAAQTFFEDSNPETNMAGWSTREGSGEDAGIIPHEQCA